MRIAIIAPLVSAICEPQRGGSQAFLADLARGLARRGHQVDVHAAAGADIPGVNVIDTGVDPATLRSTLFRADRSGAAGEAAAESAFATAYAGTRKGRYDIIHNHAFDAPAISAAATAAAPVVHTLHLPPDPAVAAALRRAAAGPAAPAVVTVSAFQARAWEAVTRVDAVIPPLIPVAAIGWSARPGRGALFAGRLSPEKGAAEAIDIAAAAGLPIDVYGDAYDPGYARDRIGPRRGLPGVTVRDGVPRPELWRVMARAAVVLCPARWDEPFGMVAAEAAACGTPVVAFRRGGLAEAVADGVTGVLVPPDDLAAATGAVRRAAGLPRDACRAYAEKNFNIERSLDAHEQLYRRVAQRRLDTAAGG